MPLNVDGVGPYPERPLAKSAPRAGLRSWPFAGPGVGPGGYGLDTPVAGGGAWTVEPHDDATHRRALVNGPSARPGPATVALVRDLEAVDADLHTRCRGACGVVFRARDEATHYAVHLDPGPSEVVLSLVQGGEPQVRAVERDGDHARRWPDAQVQQPAAQSVDVGVELGVADGATGNDHGRGPRRPAGVVADEAVEHQAPARVAAEWAAPESPSAGPRDGAGRCAHGR